MTTPPPAPKHTLYDIANYSIGMKQQKLTKETSSSVRVRRTEDVYHREGLRRTGTFIGDPLVCSSFS